MTDANCPCVCHGHGEAHRPACDVPGGCGHLHRAPTHDVTGVMLDLAFIGEHWASLAASRQPGTARPWRQPLLDAEQRARMAERDRIDRAVRNPDAPGFTSAAMHVDVLDVMVEIWVTVDELASRIAMHVVATNLPQLQVRRLDQLPSMLAFVETWLATAADAEISLGRPGRALHRLTGEVQRLLSLVRGGQLLAGAVCPWCLGVTPKQPAGGAITLRVEQLTPAKPATKHRPAIDAVHAVVCWNPTCTPSDSDVGSWYKGRPAWPAVEWEWLADRLIADKPLTRLVLTAPSLSEDIVHSGRSGMDASVCIAPSSGGVLDGVRFIDEEGSTA